MSVVGLLRASLQHAVPAETKQNFRLFNSNIQLTRGTVQYEKYDLIKSVVSEVLTI